MSDDLIKREDAIRAVEECLKLLARPRYTVKTAIEAIPSVDIPHSDDWEKYSDKLWKNAYERGKADRPQGKWIYGEHDVAMCDGYRCDRCGFFVPWDYEHKFIDFINDYHFCPNCGSKMRGEHDD